MKILFVVPYAPTKIRMRSSNLLRVFSKRGHELTLATIWEDDAERETLEGLKAQGVRVVSEHLGRPRIAVNLTRALVSGAPLQARYSFHPRLARALDNLVRNERYNVVHVEHLRGAPYGLALQQRLKGTGTPVVFDAVDCITLLFERAAQHSRSSFGRWITRLDLPRTRRFEAYLASRFNRTILVARPDMERLCQLVDGRSKGLELVTLGVDLDYFHPPENGDRAIQNGEERLVFSGKLSYHANVTAGLFLAQEVMPRVWAERPGVKVWLAGKDPHPALRQAAQAEPRLEVTGTVDDLRPYLWGARLAVAPLVYGAGIQGKVLEAMACGTAVAATPQAVAALDKARDGETLAVGEGAEGLARAILGLLADPERRRRIAAGGLAYVRREHDWDAIAARLEQIYREAGE